MDNATHGILKQTYSIEELIPGMDEIINSLGGHSGSDIPDDIQYLVEEGMKIFKDLAHPAGLLSPIEKIRFQDILRDNESHEARIPLTEIVKEADKLALFIFTLGRPLSDKIQKLIQEKDYPLGFVLDIIASGSAERATIIQEKRFEKANTGRENKALLYSPGYCGWHVSAQKKIFEYLNPEQIGITLNNSFLMTPLKSVSGILVAGEKKIHNFKNNFGFCRDCISHTCIGRMKQ